MVWVVRGWWEWWSFFFQSSQLQATRATDTLITQRLIWTCLLKKIDRRQVPVGPMAPTSWNVLCLRYLADFSLKLAKMTDMGLENWQLHHHHLLLFFLMIMAQIVAWGQLLLILTSSKEEEPYDELSEGQPRSYQNNHLCDTTRTHRWSSKATLTP